MAGIEGRARRPDRMKTVIKVEKGGRSHIGQEGRARSVEGRGRRDLGPEIWDDRKTMTENGNCKMMTENGKRVLKGVHAGCRSFRSPTVVCRFHPFEQ